MSGPRHTAHEQPFEVVIRYPHHPRAGECVVAYRRVVHAGRIHFVIEQPDGCRVLLPAWMSESWAATLPTIEVPRLSLDALRELRGLVDAQVVSSSSSSKMIRTAGDGDAERPTATTRSIRAHNKRNSPPSARSHRSRGDRKSTQATDKRVQRRPRKGKGSGR